MSTQSSALQATTNMAPWTGDTSTNIVSFARAALCQVYDSIFMDVPMSRVKFNVNTEYAYIQNFKVLQSKSTPPMQDGPTTWTVSLTHVLPHRLLR
jgi:hypothetical protein